MEITLPVSVGEAVDKYSILQIKQSEISDVDRLEKVHKESAAIFPFVKHILQQHVYLYECLYYVNKLIWDLSDRIRDASIPESEKVDLYAKTFTWNDARFRIKSKINELCSSTLKEQKSYIGNGVVVAALPNISVYEMHSIRIRYLSIAYDVVNVLCASTLTKDVETLFQDDPHILVGAPTMKNAVEIDLGQNMFSVPSSFGLLKRSPSCITLNYIVGGKLGDFIHLLYVVMCKYLATGKKGNVYIADNLKYAAFTTSAETVYTEMHEIIEAQPYIESFSVFKSQEVTFDVNLNAFRDYRVIWEEGWLNFLPKIFHTPTVFGSWISLPRLDKYKDVLLIHRSMPHTHHNSSFMPFLRFLATNNPCMFLTCTQAEYDAFPHKDVVPLEKVHTLKEMYEAINSCLFFIGNQSSPLAIAYSLGKPCLCESMFNKFYTDSNRPPHTFFWESETSNFVEGMEKYVKTKNLIY